MSFGRGITLLGSMGKMGVSMRRVNNSHHKQRSGVCDRQKGICLFPTVSPPPWTQGQTAVTSHDLQQCRAKEKELQLFSPHSRKSKPWRLKGFTATTISLKCNPMEKQCDLQKSRELTPAQKYEQVLWKHLRNESLWEAAHNLAESRQQCSSLGDNMQKSGEWRRWECWEKRLPLVT